MKNSPKQYSSIKNKSKKQLENELKKVKKTHFSDGPGYGDPTFDEMVNIFANDDFYHLHYVAKRYKEICMNDAYHDIDVQ